MPPQLFLLDTSIPLHLIRGQSTGRYIDATFQLRQQVYTPLISNCPDRGGLLLREVDPVDARLRLG